MLAFSDFSEEMVVFQLYLVFHIEIMSCGFENREIVAGLLVQAQICEPDNVLGRAVVSREVSKALTFVKGWFSTSEKPSDCY